jgi:hypothetical protein
MKSINHLPRLLIFSLLSLTFMISACKKDKVVSSKTSLLTAGSWKMTAFTIDPAYPIYDSNFNITGYTTDMFATMDACDKDDTHLFKVDYSVVTDEGATKCDPANPQTTTGTWSLNSDETVITITEDGVSQTATLLELTSSVLKFKTTDTFGTETETNTITFSH